MATSGRTCQRCLEPIRDCLCTDDDQDDRDPFAVPFLPPSDREAP